MLSPAHLPSRGHRAAVSLVVIAAIVVGTLVIVPVYKSVTSAFHLFGATDSKAKTEVVTLTADQQAAQAAQTVANAAASAAAANQAKLDAAAKAKQDHQHQLAAGVGDALAKETHPSLPVQVAITLNADEQQAFDPIDQPKLDAMQALVNQLTSQATADRAAGQAQLDTLTSQLATEKANVATLTTDKVALAGQVATANATAATLQGKVTSDAKALQGWAADNATLLARVAKLTLWLGVLAGVLFLVHWLLPLLGIAFPAFAPIAKAASAVLALPIHLLHTLEAKAAAAIHATTTATLATTTTQLASEVAAHAATTATLVQVALTPDVAPTPANEAVVAAAAKALAPVPATTVVTPPVSTVAPTITTVHPATAVAAPTVTTTSTPPTHS